MSPPHFCRFTKQLAKAKEDLERLEGEKRKEIERQAEEFKKKLLDVEEELGKSKAQVQQLSQSQSDLNTKLSEKQKELTECLASLAKMEKEKVEAAEAQLSSAHEDHNYSKFNIRKYLKELEQENELIKRENNKYKEEEIRREEIMQHEKELVEEQREIQREKKEEAVKKKRKKEEKENDREKKRKASQQPQFSPVKEEEEIAEEKKMSNDVLDTSQWKFVFSGLSAQNRKIAQQFIDDLGCQGISNSVDSSVTHVVVKTGENLEAQRTLKFLQAVSSGIKIVSFLWVEACLKDRDNLHKADNWEALDEELNGANGPYRARKGREEGKKQLLSGFEVLIDGQIEGLNKPNIEDLLFRAGARTVSRRNMFSGTAGITRLVLVNSVNEYGQKKVTKMLRSFRLAVVNKDWLLDTVSSHSRRPLQGYTLDIVKKVDLRRAGYSGMLTESD